MNILQGKKKEFNSFLKQTPVLFLDFFATLYGNP